MYNIYDEKKFKDESKSNVDVFEKKKQKNVEWRDQKEAENFYSEAWIGRI